MGLEGIVSKRRDKPYARGGARTGSRSEPRHAAPTRVLETAPCPATARAPPPFERYSERPTMCCSTVEAYADAVSMCGP